MKLKTVNVSAKGLLTLLVCTRITDVVTTYIVTPDLQREKNMLTVYVFNRSWLLVIIFQILFTVGLIGLFVYLKMKAQLTLLEKKEMSVHSFFSMQFFCDEHSFHKLLLHSPVQNKPLYWYLAAYYGIVGMITAGMMVSAGNIMGPAGFNLFWFPPYWIYRIVYIGISLCMGGIMTERHMQYLYSSCHASNQTA